MTATVTTLYCDHCGQEEVHEIRYVGQVMTTITCARCGTGIGAPQSVAYQYVRDLGFRVANKPGRVVRQAVHHPRTFLVQLPGSLATKPVRLAAEFHEVARLELAPWAERVRPLLRRFNG